MILVGGENLIDLLGQPQGALFRAVPGGSPFNVAKAAARLGANVGYVTPISTDPMGQMLADDLGAEGVAVLAPRSDKPSALALVTLQDGQPAYQFYRTDTADRAVSVALLNRIIPRKARGFHIGSLALASGRDAKAWAQMLVAVHKRGVFTSLDPNIRPAFIKNRSKYLSRLQWVAGHSDLIKLSDEDISWISPDTPVEQAAEALFAQSGAALLVLTMGEKGAVAFHASGTQRLPAAPVQGFKDAVGAGDTFCAALLAELDHQNRLSGDALRAMDRDGVTALVRFAARCAALNCQSSGCNPPYRRQLGAG